ncbi:hypothetical protein CEXT_731811 [Caerostris extrusa]|uniref:Uncharacterized protein n=1 Tax=Caerostris extrusa TaxID=172846 RepID=A0AAV4ND16_CAEEX|nr:hypothetical protein CEXT_731811 [Caerostris extrusa]
MRIKTHLRLREIETERDRETTKQEKKRFVRERGDVSSGSRFSWSGFPVKGKTNPSSWDKVSFRLLGVLEDGPLFGVTFISLFNGAFIPPERFPGDWWKDRFPVTVGV